MKNMILCIILVAIMTLSGVGLGCAAVTDSVDTPVQYEFDSDVNINDVVERLSILQKNALSEVARSSTPAEFEKLHGLVVDFQEYICEYEYIGNVFDVGCEAVLSNYLNQINSLNPNNPNVRFKDKIGYSILVNDFKNIANSVHYHKI